MLDETVIDSLKNRRVLLEREVDIYKGICAKAYLDQINLQSTPYYVEIYSTDVDHLTTLMGELNQVNIFLGE